MKETEEEAVAALAEQIRAAVAENAPGGAARRAPGGWPGATDSAASESLENVRRPLSRAEEHLTPSIPEGVRLSAAKRFALRLLRFLWREQTAFNALSLEAQNALLSAVEELRRDLAALRQDLEVWKRDQEHERRRLEQGLEALDASWNRRASIRDGRLAALEARALSSAADRRVGPVPEVRELPPGVYNLFEERFRGAPGAVAEKQRFYLPFLKGLPGPVCDVGCGRGEFLTLLREGRIPALGVETNPLSVALARAAGLKVEQGDGISYLTRQPAGSLGGVVAFQVVEHWPAAATFAFLTASRRALAPGGVLIAETINTDSLSALKAFFLDPTHVRPVPADALRFLAETAGFPETRIEYRARLPPEERLEEGSANDAKLNRLLFGPQDYALIARIPAEAGGGSREAEGGEART